MRNINVRIASLISGIALIASAGVVTASAAQAVAPAADTAYTAAVGDCFNYSYKELSGVWQMGQTPVDCGTTHTGMTLYVGTSKSLTTMPPAGVLSESQAAALRGKLTADSKTCLNASMKAVGPAAELSRYGYNQLYQVSPTGGVDLRCDAILYTANYKGIQGMRQEIRDTAPEYMRCAKLANNRLTYRACGKGVGIAARFGYLNKNGTKAYPGEAKVRTMFGKACREFNFWGANTTKEAWKAGASYTCYYVQ